VQNKISTIENLEGLSNLRQIELGANRVREIQGLETLTALEELWLGKNKITEIKGLDTLSNLKILSIQSNRLRTITGLDNLTNLEELHISHNLLTELSGLDNNTNLRVIDISANPIEHLGGLKSLKHLTEFWASNCKLSDYAEIERELRDKEELETVYFEGNPLQRSQPALYRNKVRLALPQVVQIDASEFGLFSPFFFFFLFACRDEGIGNETFANIMCVFSFRQAGLVCRTPPLRGGFFLAVHATSNMHLDGLIIFTTTLPRLYH